MPKQRRYDFKRLQGSSSSKVNSDEDGTAASVNEQLTELRRADPAVAAMRKQEMASIVNQPTVPPALRNILGVPETAPPRARRGTRIARTRTPGPAPPSSWLNGDQSGITMSKSKRVKGKATIGRKRPDVLFRFAKLCGMIDTVDTTTLSHYCLKQLASNWDLLEEEDYHSLAVLPPAVRTRLFSYLSFYGPAVSMQAFKALVNDETTSMLDLAGLVGNDDLTLVKLTKHIKTSTRVTQEATVTESWEDEEHEQSAFTTIPTPFTTLTHLCLSHPPKTVRWQDLLHLTKYTPTLTHLSLAYWPRPTLTPNLATTTVQNRFGADITAGGSHFYSDFDEDLDEPRALLKQLSHNLLQLQWLDIDGNQSWLLALAGSRKVDIESGRDTDVFPGNFVPTTGLTRTVMLPEESRMSNELVTTWRNLAYIRCASSYLPGFPHRERRPGQTTWLPYVWGMVSLTDLAQWLGTSNLQGGHITRHQEWCSAEQKIVTAAACINNVRRVHRCSPIAFDLGWNYK